MKYPSLLSVSLETEGETGELYKSSNNSVNVQCDC